MTKDQVKLEAEDRTYAFQAFGVNVVLNFDDEDEMIHKQCS